MRKKGSKGVKGSKSIQKTKFRFVYLYIILIIAICIIIPIYAAVNMNKSKSINSSPTFALNQASPTSNPPNISNPPISATSQATSNGNYTLSGVSQEEVKSVKSIVERIVFKLNELSTLAIDTPNQSITPQEDNKDSNAIYTELAAKIDMDKVVYFMVTLKNDFGSYEKVLDEYLFCLQAGLNLEDYSKDKEKYLKQKEEKVAEIGANNVISSESIENKIIESIQQRNEKNRQNNLDKFDSQNQPINPMPEVPKVPGVEINKPKDPLEGINPNSQLPNTR